MERRHCAVGVYIEYSLVILNTKMRLTIVLYLDVDHHQDYAHEPRFVRCVACCQGPCGFCQAREVIEWKGLELMRVSACDHTRILDVVLTCQKNHM